jgi:hypothetical protein
MGTIRLRSAATLLAIVLAQGCGGPKTAPPPGPGEARGTVPDLRGRTVLVLPVQIKSNVPQGIIPDAEFSFALASRGEGVSWVFASDVDKILERSPGVRVQIRNLPVDVFLRAEVNRVGDPLFGNVARASALVGAEVAIIPVAVTYGPPGAYVVSAAILDVRTGRVAWYGVVEGDEGEATNPQTLASAMDILARGVMRNR